MVNKHLLNSNRFNYISLPKISTKTKKIKGHVAMINPNKVVSRRGQLGPSIEIYGKKVRPFVSLE